MRTLLSMLAAALLLVAAVAPAAAAPRQTATHITPSNLVWD